MPTLTGLILTAGEGVLTPPIHMTATLSLSGWNGTLKAYYGSVVRIGVVPGKIKLWSYGHTGGPVNGAVLVYGGEYGVSTRFGSIIRLEVPTLTLSFSGITEGFARVAATLPKLTLVASGTTDILARATLTLPSKWPHTIYGGGVLRKTLPKLTIGSSGTADRYMRLKKTLPRLILSAHAYTDNVMTVIGVLPTVHAAPSAVVIRRLPRLTLYMSGTTGAAAAYEAYSMTLIPEERQAMDIAGTHYTNYPFDRFVRFNNKYYGVAADGLFELAGNDFNGTPIVAVVKTATLDFNARELKRPISLYIGGSVSADFRVTVSSAEVRDDKYTYHTVDKTGVRNYRVLFGKGIRARYLAYTLTNIDGGDFELDDLTPEFVVMRRTA